MIARYRAFGKTSIGIDFRRPHRQNRQDLPEFPSPVYHTRRPACKGVNLLILGFREGRAPSRPFAPPLGRTISIPVIIYVCHKRYPCYRGKIRAIVGKAVGRNLPQNTLNGQRPSLNTQNVLGACRVPKFSVFSVPRDAPWTGRSMPRRQEVAQGKSSG